MKRPPTTGASDVLRTYNGKNQSFDLVKKKKKFFLYGDLARFSPFFLLHNLLSISLGRPKMGVTSPGAARPIYADLTIAQNGGGRYNRHMHMKQKGS